MESRVYRSGGKEATPEKKNSSKIGMRQWAKLRVWRVACLRYHSKCNISGEIKASSETSSLWR